MTHRTHRTHRASLTPLSLAAIAVAAMLTAQVAAQPQPKPAAAVPAGTPAAPAGSAESVLPGRPDPIADANGSDSLDPAFMSVAAGISVRPPTGGKMLHLGGNPDELVRFVSEDQHWQFVVSRVMLTQPVPIATSDPEAAKTNPSLVGFADSVAGQMPSDTTGKLVRSELMPINGYDGAVLASKFTDKGTKRLMQQAVIRRTDKVYYVLTYTTTLTGDDVQNDPAADRALATFTKVLDSAKLLDQEEITRDQNERLVRTRALMVNWTADKLKSVLVPEQWLRLLKDGKDVGYTYIVEEPAGDIPRVGRPMDDSDKLKQTGVRIGIRSRTVPDAGVVVDAESWMWVRYDRKQETFRNLLVSTEQGKKPSFAMELGTSADRDRIIPVKVGQPNGLGQQIVAGKDDRIELQVWTSSKEQTMPALQKEVPPFYLSQGLIHLLPRIVPLNDPKTYMFASYVSETRQVMTRYVDVLPAATVNLGGKKFVAVPVQDRAGLEGSITTHYISPEGKYLGSINEDNKITILSTDAATLKSIWKDANLERPAAVEDPSAKK